MQAHIKDSITITPIGESSAVLFNSMLEGKSALQYGTSPCISAFSKESKWYGCSAGQLLREMICNLASGNELALDDPSLLTIISTTKGDIGRLEHGEYHLSALAVEIKEDLGLANIPMIISNACISGVSAIIVAKRLVENGCYKNIIVAGADTVTEFVYSGFDSFKSLDPTPCRPYDSERKGLNLGEAGAALLIAADGEIVIMGGAISNDANHISGPSRTGDGLYLAIKEAMEEAYGTLSHPVSFVNTHGTATIYNDEMESKAMALAGLSQTPLNSIKGYIGHTLGTSGVVEAAICIEELKRGIILGTRGFSDIGVPCNVNISSEHRVMDSPCNCIKTASGFGGCNAAVVLALKSAESRQESREKGRQKSLQAPLEMENCRQLHKQCIIKDGKILADNKLLMESEESFHDMIRRAYKTLCEPNMKFYKMDNLCKLGYVAAETILKDEDLSNPSATAIVLANEASSLDSDLKHQNLISNGMAASPAIFVYTLPNLVLGEICIRHKIKGENTFFISSTNNSRLEEYAQILIRRPGMERVIYGWCNFFNGSYEAEFKMIKKI